MLRYGIVNVNLPNFQTFQPQKVVSLGVTSYNLSRSQLILDTKPNTDRNPGRPRAPETDRRIIATAQRLLASQGFVRMSMDAVALEAGISKPTIYRRYPNKIDLALAAVVAFCDLNPPKYKNQTRADLIAQLKQFRSAMDRPNGMALLGTMLAEESENPALLEKFREYLVVPRRQAIQEILRAAKTRHELKPNPNLELVTNMLIGTYYAQYLVGQKFSKNWEEDVVDAVLGVISL
jgi:AcrR family transcriptional regulator